MSIRRYTASADTTIVNAYKADLKTRGTGSNMGMADVMEVFSIYGRQTVSSSADQGSQELSRLLVKFPIATTAADRNASRIPASGSVSFYLRLYNAKTSKTVPRDYKLVVLPVSQSWQEGDGLDLENYRDETQNKVGSNWMASAGTDVAATATVTWTAGDRPEAGDTITIIDAAGVSKIYIAAVSQDLTSDPPKWYASNTTTTQVDSLQSCIESANGHNGSITVAQDDTGLIMTLTQATKGAGGNTTVTVAGATAGQLSSTNFTGGAAYLAWTSVGGGTSVGGSYKTGSHGEGKTMAQYIYTQTFAGGLEDLEIDISGLVEEWIAAETGSATAGIDNYGVGVHLSSSYEAYFSSSDGNNSGSVLENLQGALKSYYTKRFFARGSTN